MSFGIYLEDEGEIFLDGKKVHFENPKEAMENGVSMVHQELNQVLQRSAAENMMLGRFPKKSIFVDEKKMYEDTKRFLMILVLILVPKLKWVNFLFLKGKWQKLLRLFPTMLRFLF